MLPRPLRRIQTGKRTARSRKLGFGLGALALGLCTLNFRNLGLNFLGARPKAKAQKPKAKSQSPKPLPPSLMRLDLFLKASRLSPRRTVAQKLCDAGLVS